MKIRALYLLCMLGSSMVPAVRGQSALNQTASRAVGQPQLQIRSTAPNVVEGRELLSPWSVAIDRSTNPPGLYVADTGNNRVLGWRNATGFSNGAPADVIIGQVDRFTTLPGGPGTSRQTDLNTPGAVAVDAQGNLYVADVGNNRILRYPRPLSSGGDAPPPDMVIGQPNFNSRTANDGLTFASPRTIFLSTGNQSSRTGLAFDNAGNLWFADAQNHRVLRYPRLALDSGLNQPAADFVIGQSNFEDREQLPTGAEARLNKARLVSPSGLAFDDAGRLYVADAAFRVLVYPALTFNGVPASRIIGIGEVVQNPRPTTEYTLGNPRNNNSPEGVFSLGNRIGVVDTGSSRITIYDPFPQWEPETAQRPSPPARVIIGQVDAQSNTANRGQAEPSAFGLNEPLGAVFHNGELYVADSGNHRVVVFPSVSGGAAATRVLGQDALNFGAANLLEGKEMFLFNGFGSVGGNDGGGIALDTRSDPPRLYVADSFNNRVLAYRDARIVKPGDRADLVIGQNDFGRSLVNAPQGDPDVTTSSGLFRPVGLAVDAQGNLWVADAGNGRVLRFPTPFDQNTPLGQRPVPNLVLGQTSFTTRITDASPRNMAHPFGVAISVEGHVTVSDPVHSRILLFRRPAGGDFVNGQAADRVIGQPDFFTTGVGVGPNALQRPLSIALDTDDRLYVTDAPANRVVIYDRITDPRLGNNPPPAFTLGNLSGPQGIYVSPRTGEIWVANTRRNNALRYPRFDRLFLNSNSDYEVLTSTPLALAQDSFGNLFIAEGINRVAIFFNGLQHQNAASFNDRVVSPGMILSIYPLGANGKFGDETAAFSTVPLPRALGDVQVLVDNRVAPLYYVSPTQINLLVPMDTPSSGAAEIQVVRVSTQQILAAFRVQLAAVAPGLFVNQPVGQQGGGQVAALNQDNTVNSPQNPAARGQVVQLFGTGQGFVSSAPPDGTPPSGPLNTDNRPRVIIGADFVPDANIEYSGLAPSLVGVWQINVRIPDAVVPGNQVDVVVVMGSAPSNVGFRDARIRTTISVRQ